MGDPEALPTSRILLIGLPSTGKTSFLAALWHVVNSNDIPGSLQLVRLDQDSSYLNAIAKVWLASQDIGRTRIDVAVTDVSMLLMDPSTGKSTRVRLPDLSGETYQRHIEDRFWSIGFDQLVSEATGAMLFIHPSKMKEPKGIDQVMALEVVLDERSGASAATGEEGEPWSIQMMPTQVELVELLQFVSERRNQDSALRIAVVVSAWDLVRILRKTPQEFVAERLPLLVQYLEANSKLYTIHYFGVSAFGGDPKRDVKRLLDVEVPSERILVESDGESSCDITLPIKWLMSE